MCSLSEFVNQLRNHSISLNTGGDASSGISDYSTNLFENYSGYDLSSLHGEAILIPQKEVLDGNLRHDNTIMLLNPYSSVQFQYCHESADKRLEALFRIKEKWTKAELNSYIKPFMDLSTNFDTYLLKNTRVIPDKNPFNSGLDITYYVRKF